MNSTFKTLATASALALLGTGGAQASVIGVTATGGSEVLLNIVSNADSSSISLDLGTQLGGIALGNTFALPQGILDFISGAGGLAGVRFSVVGGGGVNGTATAQYLHSSNNETIGNIANGVRGTWFSNLNNFIANRLNASKPTDTDTAANNLYGPFSSGVNGNYLTNGSDDWGTAGTCVANDNVCNLVAGTEAAKLFVIGFGTTPTGFATRTDLVQGVGGVYATLDLANSRLEINAVPVPAAAWLGATAFGLVGLRARRRKAG